MRLFHFLRHWMERTTAKRSVGSNWPATLTGRQIFILPSGFGMTTTGVILTLLLVALNYQNSAVFMLAFVLGSLLLAAMVITHRHLRGLVINDAAVDPVFAGESPCLRIRVSNPRRRARQGLQAFDGNHDSRHLTLQPGSTEDVILDLPASGRGRHQLRRLGLACTEPFGTFRAWSRLQPVDYIVYPKPAANATPPPGFEGHGGSGATHAQPDDFAGLAPYRPGDRPGQIAWRSYARSGELERKHFAGGGRSVLWLDFNETPTVDTESRLSILTSWCLAAEHTQQPWGLRLPGHEIALGNGPRHLAACLRALALFPGPYGGND